LTNYASRDTLQSLRSHNIDIYGPRMQFNYILNAHCVKSKFLLKFSNPNPLNFLKNK